ncbi:MAG: GNAT family N-acetyltransferase [Gammaproteobacteria bacterium]|nr:GNAT family N-acetyltransferase [Gammaproteobacteria bacterium]
MIRKAGKTDLESIRRFAFVAFRKYVPRIGREPAPMVADFEAAIENENLYVLTGDGRIRGFVVFYPHGDHLHLENVAVDPEYQGRGDGFRLIEFVEQAATNAGYDRVELYTNAKMTENLEFYPGLGYEAFARKIEDGFDRIYFRKALS